MGLNGTRLALLLGLVIILGVTLASAAMSLLHLYPKFRGIPPIFAIVVLTAIGMLATYR
jgi:hypothetical protein